MARGDAAHLPRRRAGRRQDLRDAQRGRRRRASAAPTWSSASSRPTAGRTPRRRSATSRSSRAARSTYRGTDVRGDGRRRGPRPATRRSRWSTSSRTPTCPGSRNEKRWQDVEELLDAGIDVISTVNIQHLESLNDVVERDHRRSSSARRCPTRSCARADQIELVDMTPEALRRRMAHGNIYPPEKVDAALANYFRAGQPRRAARAGAAVGRRPGRRGAPGVPRGARHRRTVGDARAGRRRAHRRARRRRRHPPRRAHGDARPRRADRRARRSGRRAAPDRRSSALERAARSCSRARRRVPRGRGADVADGARGVRPGGERDAARARREPAVALEPSSLRGSVINGVHPARRAPIDVHVISTDAARTTASASRSRPRRPRGAAPLSPRRRHRSAWTLAVARCRRCSRCVLASVRDALGAAERPARCSCCSSSSSPRVGGFAARRSCRDQRRSCSPTGSSRRRSTRSRSPRARTSSRSSSSSSWPASSAWLVDRRSAADRRRRAGARRGRGARRARRHAVGDRRPAAAARRRSCAPAFAADAVAVLQPSRRRWLDVEAGAGRAAAGSTRRRPTSRSRLPAPRSLVARRAPRSRDEDREVLRAFAAPGRGRGRAARAARRGRAAPPGSPRRTSCGPRCSRRCRTTCARRCVDQGVGHEPAASATSSGRPTATERVPRDDRRGDRPAQPARRQPARHEPAADRRARSS